MLDVHAPHTSTHTLRDFLIHIATISVGLLIAIGLEQGVEAIHRHHERDQLRAALNRESQQILYDSTRADENLTTGLEYLKLVERTLSEAIRTHQTFVLPPPPSSQGSSYDLPNEPVLKAAKSTGTLALLTDDEVIAYGEMDLIMEHVSIEFAAEGLAENKAAVRVHEIQIDEKPESNSFARATPEQLRQLDSDLVVLENSRSSLLTKIHSAQGAATAMLAGERDLRKIQMAERKNK